MTSSRINHKKWGKALNTKALPHFIHSTAYQPFSLETSPDQTS